MKKKDIITLIISIIIISITLYFMLKMIFPASSTSTTSSNANEAGVEVEKSEWQIDDTFYEEEISDLNNYGEAGMDNIGREDPFGSIN